MAFNIQATLETIRDYIKDNERAEDARIGHRFDVPTGATYAGVTMDDARVAELTGNSTIEVHTVQIRLYRNSTGQDLDTVELDLAKKAEEILSDLFGDYDLGGTIRAVDIGGIYGSTPSVTFEWIDETTFRVADLTIPLIVDDSITPAA